MDIELQQQPSDFNLGETSEEEEISEDPEEPEPIQQKKKIQNASPDHLSTATAIPKSMSGILLWFWH